MDLLRDSSEGVFIWILQNFQERYLDFCQLTAVFKNYDFLFKLNWSIIDTIC